MHGPVRLDVECSVAVGEVRRRPYRRLHRLRVQQCKFERIGRRAVAVVQIDRIEGEAKFSRIGGYREDLGVTAPSPELDASVRRTVDNLEKATAIVSVDRVEVADGRLNVDVAVRRKIEMKSWNLGRATLPHAPTPSCF